LDLPNTKQLGGYREYYLKPKHKEDTDRGGWGSRRLLYHEDSGFVFYSPNHYGANKNIGAEANFFVVGRIKDKQVLSLDAALTEEGQDAPASADEVVEEGQ
jgi:hypothetical protein